MKKEEKRKKGKSGKKGTRSKKVKKESSVKKKKRTTTRKKSGRIKKDKKPKAVKKVEESRPYEDIDYENFGKPNDVGRLGFVEYLKLIRNCVVLLAAIIAIIFFLKKSLVVSDEIDLIVIFSSIIFSLVAFLLFVFFVKFIQDMRKGVVCVYKGYAHKDFDDVLYSSYLPFCTIILNGMVHFIGIYNYLQIKDNNFVIIRRTQVTRSIVGFAVASEENQ